MSVFMNSFHRRQTAESKFSHFEGGEDLLLSLVEENFGLAKPGYKDGVVLVPVPADGFFSGVVEVTPETELKASFGSRRKGEDPFIEIVAVGGVKLPAKEVEIVLYRRDILGGDAESPKEAGAEVHWEVISTNARPTEGPEPMTPMAMARNFLALPGGTKADYTAEEFARAIIYWSRRAMKG